MSAPLGTDPTVTQAAGPGAELHARRSVLWYALTKLGGATLSIGMVIVATFFLFRLIPGDPTIAYTRDVPVSPEQLDLLRRQMGLDRPLSQQFMDFTLRTLRLDLGASYEYRRPVSALIGERAGPTLLLAATLVFMHIGFVVAGAVSVETVYSWPGLGLLFYEAIQGPDYAVMQGTFMVLCVTVIVMNTLADVAYRILDPRVRSA